MDIILFAIIGAQINAGAWYWICYGVCFAIKLYNAIKESIKEIW
jgi:hypothetical protein